MGLQGGVVLGGWLGVRGWRSFSFCSIRIRLSLPSIGLIRTNLPTFALQMDSDSVMEYFGLFFVLSHIFINSVPSSLSSSRTLELESALLYHHGHHHHTHPTLYITDTDLYHISIIFVFTLHYYTPSLARPRTTLGRLGLWQAVITGGQVVYRISGSS